MGFNLHRNVQFLISVSTLSFSNQIIDASNHGIDHTDTRYHFSISVNLCANTNAHYGCMLLRLLRKIASSRKIVFNFLFQSMDAHLQLLWAVILNELRYKHHCMRPVKYSLPTASHI